MNKKFSHKILFKLTILGTTFFFGYELDTTILQHIFRDLSVFFVLRYLYAWLALWLTKIPRQELKMHIFAFDPSKWVYIDIASLIASWMCVVYGSMMYEFAQSETTFFGFFDFGVPLLIVSTITFILVSKIKRKM